MHRTGFVIPFLMLAVPAMAQQPSPSQAKIDAGTAEVVRIMGSWGARILSLEEQIVQCQAAHSAPEMPRPGLPPVSPSPAPSDKPMPEAKP